MDQPESTVPVQTPHVHKMWNVMSILFLVLFILSVVFNVFLFMSWSSATEDVGEYEVEVVVEEGSDDDKAVEEAIKNTQTFTLGQGSIKFDYPENWHVFTDARGERPVITVNNGPITFIESPQFFPVSVEQAGRGFADAESTTVVDYFVDTYAANERDATLTSLSDRLHLIEGTDVFGGHHFRKYIYVGDVDVVIVTVAEKSTWSNVDLELIEDSLNFSSIN